MTVTLPARVLVCFGTRPEAIKLAPVISRLREGEGVEVLTATTAQHRELVDQVLEVFDLRPDLDLDLMRPRQSLAELTATATLALAGVLQDVRPAAVLVQGDTTTAMCAALAAYYAGVPVGHVEAGLRTGDLHAPFPEEANRRIISLLAHWHWAPTQRDAAALLAEGVAPERVFVTGNTAIDALRDVAQRPLPAGKRALLPPRLRARRILVTIHRRETQGATQRALFRMLARVAARGDAEIVFPVHRNPAVGDIAVEELSGVEGVTLLAPLDYHAFIHLMCSSDLIVTDSGGIQEEAPALGIPVLVARETTERMQSVEAGSAQLCGTDAADVEADIARMLAATAARDRGVGEVVETTPAGDARSPYGDGRAASRIAATLMADLVGAASPVV